MAEKIPTSKKQQSAPLGELDVMRVIAAYEAADNPAVARFLSSQPVANGKFGGRINTPGPQGEVVHLPDVDGFVAGFAPQLVSFQTDYPADRAKVTPDFLEYGQQRIRRFLQNMPADALVAKWAGVVVTFHRPMAGITSATEAAAKWMTEKRLPGRRADTLVHFTYGVGYRIDNENRNVTIQGYQSQSIMGQVSAAITASSVPLTVTTLAAGIEYVVDYNDRPAGTVADFASKIDTLVASFAASYGDWLA